jgi:hypothetical protein
MPGLSAYKTAHKPPKTTNHGDGAAHSGSCHPIETTFNFRCAAYACRR